MKIILDTNFIIGLLVKSDSTHQRALELVKSDILNNECYITNLITQEFITILGIKTKNRDFLRKSYDMLKDNFKLINEFEIDKLNDKTFKICYNSNHKLSFVDSSLVEVSHAYNIDKIVSFDKNLKKLYPNLVIN